ncbi:SusD-like starch-binding protein associating with outer membrane [Chitinophaga skermanii]|uniref:SusD-like starch-binding protein associating with outer membrane n=1 Tax=Chitinophaga skermanii TaxID=331697 RepID=A0A327QQT3_9BACT|nr:SusD/RagB family nutrient-binding outer membrane lipoprotein [Chitinophaga skermanii]RAJ06956.1 SusD-like starch-binding protein associating with outer membrane [Chitinophaga skermanii]
MKKLIKSCLALAIGGLTLGACSISDDMNVNPNLPKEGSNAFLLTYAIQQTPNMVETIYGNLYIQHWSEKIYTDASRYTNINFSNYSFYADPLMNLQSIIEAKNLSDEDGSVANQVAVARILRAIFYWHMTDRWGDIPYTNALKGQRVPDPAYDTQQAIYADLFKELKAAQAQIDAGKGPTGDILYNGNMTKWKHLANTVRMLMALRLSKIDAQTGATEFNAAIADGAFANNAENAVYKHLPDANNQNNWYYVFIVQKRRWYAISEALANYMNSTNDPRIKVFADPRAADGKYAGMPYGVDGAVAGNIPESQVSMLGASLRAQDAPTNLVTFPQVLFAMAEAAKLGWINGGDASAANYYKQAIEQSVRQWRNNDTTGLGALMTAPGVPYDPANAVKQIAYQRWVHLYMNGYEAWAEWRRTGFPVLTPAPDNNNLPIPRRQGYPVLEPALNEKNYKDAVQRQTGFNGKDDLNGRVWWDKQ